MRFSDILTVDRVTTELGASDKQEALRALARMFACAGAQDAGLDEELVYRTLSDREDLASTGVGSGVAIPHGRLQCVNEVEAAVAISHDGVFFDSVDGKPAQIFIAVLAPEHHTGQQLKVLARISRVLKDADVRRRLLDADSRERVLAIMMEEEDRHLRSAVL